MAVVSILMYVSVLLRLSDLSTKRATRSLSWADTTASTFGRLYGHLTPKLPSSLLGGMLPLAPRKSLAGSLAAFLTGALVVVGFWGWAVDAGGMSPEEAVWSWDLGGWAGLTLLGVGAGMITSVTEALGELFDRNACWSAG